MRKILPLFLLILILVAVSAYSAVWYLQSAQLKAETERLIAQFNAREKILTYENLSVTGFPMRLSVDITQPKINGRMDEALRNMIPFIEQGGVTPVEEQLISTISQLPEWSENITFAGHVQFGVNVFSDRYTFALDGPITQTSTIAGVPVTFVTSSTSPNECTLQLQRPQSLASTLWDTGRLGRDPLQLLQDFRQLDCRIAAYTVTDDATKQIVNSASPGAIALSHTPHADGSRGVSFALKIHDQEVKSAYDAFLNRYILLFSSVPGAPAAVNLAAYGKQQVNVEFSVLAPPNFGQMGSGGPFRFTINNLQLVNALYNQVGKLDINNTVQGATRELTIFGDFTTSFTPSYDQFLTDYIQKTVAQIKVSADPALAPMQAIFAPYTPEQIVSLLRPVIVHLSGFGPIVSHVDASMKGDEALRTGTLEIKRMEMSATPYGIMLAGKAGLTGDAQGVSPDTNLTLTCRNCVQLIADAGAYAQRAEAVYNVFSPPAAGQAAPAPIISPTLAEGVQNFVQTLATQQKDATGTTLYQFTIAGVSSGPGGLTVNGKPMGDVVQLYAQTIAPHLPGGTPAQPVVLQPMPN